VEYLRLQQDLPDRGRAKTTEYLKIWADLNVNVNTSASLTLIGDFGDLGSWTESHVLFRHSGSVKATINLDAYAQMRFNTGKKEIFGLQDFGATFSIPGIVTVGPNLKVFAQLDGEACFHA
jgi:chitinase